MPRESRIRFARASGALLAVLGSATLWTADARAQVAGTSNKPLPDVLLLVDTSGSMERTGNGALPEADPATECKPGVESEPNRWGMLLQALTGNLQPYYSCEALSRLASASPPKFKNEYGINGKDPYDLDYFLPYHRPMTGTDGDSACLISPYKLPGAASGGVGPSKRTAGGDATDFPDDALVRVKRKAFNDANQNLTTTDQCAFEQTEDGQLDAARDYVRFALMTFDNDPSGATGADTSLKNLTVTDPFTGQWSYRRSSSNPFFNNITSTDGSAWGNPAACAAQVFEVGARNEAAPPWEGRLVPFPPPTASLFDMQRTNQQIQEVLLASRPYGATPLAGMLDDARDLFWYRTGGPKDDPYFCRDKYIIMLTDGAPNQDLRPSCDAFHASSGPVTTGACPYEKVEDIADKLATDSTRPVRTYVIGFSVNGSGSFPAKNDGFPSGITNCKSWYDAAGNDPTAMQTECNTRIAGGDVPVGSTAEACCTLNTIALNGSEGTSGPYFAESQADIVLSFGQIMADIVKEASTRTLPAYTPTAEFSVASFATTGTRAGQFVGSFIPNVQRPWSGEIDRTRLSCTAGLPTEEIQKLDKGDFMSANVAVQAVAKKRVFFSVLGDKYADGSIDSTGTLRPFANGTPTSTTGADDIPASSGQEVKMLNDNAFVSDWPAALGITDKTCKRSKSIKRGTGAGARGTITIPALDKNDCTKAVWGFTTAFPDALKLAPAAVGESEAYDFNIRCGGGSSSTAGMCSVSGTACTLGQAGDCGAGEVCVPECAALGAIFRSNPTVLGPPTGFLREDGFRTFQAARQSRRPTLFVATTDGILHAFNAMDEDGASAQHELWSFVPPAVLPKLASNYPAGNQILLDGSPVVRETVWDRVAGDEAGANSGRTWHTTLVAGLGAGGGGYYALNVTDADCRGKESNGGADKSGNCLTNDNFEVPTQGSLEDVSAGGVIESSKKRGPHFLWQLTDVPKGTGDQAKLVGTRSGVDRVALFGRQSGTPAIGTVQIMSGGVERQIGVAILPGGIDGAPFSGTCPRLGSGTDFAMHDPGPDTTAVRANVRKWAKDCDAPVPGRGVTIVRLDTGEVVRHFGRLTASGAPADAPVSVTTKTTHVPFDSPMIGVPVVYPDMVGVPIQKVFIGDADGTLWRIDLTSTDPTKWSGALFQDLYAGITGPTAATAGQPIQVPPVLSTDDAGQLIVNVATGDQESLVYTGDKNYVFSLREARDATSLLPVAKINWFRQLQIGTDEARVTGPMVVFDRTLYFATYTPRVPAAGNTPACLAGGVAHLWGLHYTEPGSGGISAGGAARFCKDGDVGSSGICNASIEENQEIGPDLIPGVTLRATAACASPAAFGDDGAFAFSSITPQSYQLSFGIATRSSKVNEPPMAHRLAMRQPTPRNSTRIDSWALVIE